MDDLTIAGGTMNLVRLLAFVVHSDGKEGTRDIRHSAATTTEPKCTWNV
jgi:hypothetical protein